LNRIVSPDKLAGLYPFPDANPYHAQAVWYDSCSFTG
jgi:hypothetical protein